MKSFIILAVACAVISISEAGFSAEQKKEMEDRLVADCSKKESSTTDDLAELAARKKPSTKSGHCLHACIVETLGFIKEGRLHLESVVDMAKLVYEGDNAKINIAQEVTKECSGITDDDRCELAAKLYDCVTKECEKRGISFSDIM